MSDAESSVPNIDQKSRGACATLYVVGFVSVPLFFMLGVFILASTPWFLTHDAYPGMQQAGYSLRLKHADCEIAIYGDSSALTGLDPDIIQKITGLTTCNLSEGTTIQGVVGSRFPLDTYLKDNRRPLYLLTMYTPSIFRPYVPPFDAYQPEGMMYLLQYDRSRETYLGLLRNFKWVIDFDIWAGRQIIKDFLNRYIPGRDTKAAADTRTQREERHGIWPYPVPPETHCVRTAYHLSPKDVRFYADSVTQMRNIYATEGTTVVVNISPVPTCDTLQQTYRDLSQGFHDNAFETLPISDFNEGDVHFSADGSQHISVEAGNQILALEASRRLVQKSMSVGKLEHPQ